MVDSKENYKFDLGVKGLIALSSDYASALQYLQYIISKNQSKCRHKSVSYIELLDA